MRLNITVRIMLSGLLAMFFMLVLMGINLFQSQQIRQAYRGGLDSSHLVEEAQALQVYYEKEVVVIRGFLMSGDESYLQPLAQVKQDAEATTGRMRPLLKTAEERALVDDLEKVNQHFLDLINEEIRLTRSGKRDEAIALAAGEGKVAKTRLGEQSQQFVDQQRAIVKAETERAEASAARTVWIGLSVAAVALLLAGFLSIRIARAVARPIVAVSAMALQLADGNMQVAELPVTSRDEVGQMSAAMNQMVAGLRSLIQRVGQAASTVGDASQALNTASQQVTRTGRSVRQAVTEVAAGAATQAQSSAAARAVVGQLEQAIAQIAQGAQEQAVSAQRTAATVATVDQTVAEVVRTAEGVHASSLRTRADGPVRRDHGLGLHAKCRCHTAGLRRCGADERHDDRGNCLGRQTGR